LTDSGALIARVDAAADEARHLERTMRCGACKPRASAAQI